MTVHTNNQKNENIIKTTSFENLKKMENEGKFNENAKTSNQKKINFFHLGKKNKWEILVKKEITDEVERIFLKQMKELNYL
jgi:hypothetical protein